MRVTTPPIESMKQTRRNVLRKVSALSAVTLGASGLAAAADCSSYPDWRSDTSYTDGDRVVYNGSLWEAQWWTQANEPETSDSVWVEVGPCNGSGSGGDGGDGGGGGNTAPSALVYREPDFTRTGGNGHVSTGTVPPIRMGRSRPTTGRSATAPARAGKRPHTATATPVATPSR